jgi:hypothetical protein
MRLADIDVELGFVLVHVRCPDPDAKASELPSLKATTEVWPGTLVV